MDKVAIFGKKGSIAKYDLVKNKPVWVPPSVVLQGVISFNDSIAHEWFAPAGLNRGGLSSVLEAKTRLTHTERDELYEGRVNPIASFPGQGVVVFGQKTLQGKPSALDRINVRRLLIRLRKFIACLLYTSPSPRDATLSRMPSSA